MTNNEAGPIQLALVSGALTSDKPLAADAPAYEGILHNLTAAQYNLAVDAGKTEAIPYSFALDMQPQDVRVQLMAVLADDKGGIFSLPAFNGTASIVEAPTSFLDPQM